MLILDADHVPTRDFLMNTAGRFLLDKNLFMVQTPHFAINPDPVERNLRTFGFMPSEQEMFYSGVQHGLDHWNASSFCGSAALLRRRCLEEIGGISGRTITEDAETALELHSRGYHSEYIGRPMIAGLAPTTIQAFITQRSRWAQGMVQIFMLSNPLFKRGLTLPQRLCYMNSCMFWFFPLVRVLFTLAPCAFLVFGLKIYSANWQSFLTFAAPYLATVMMASNVLYGRLRWTFVSDLYELIQAIHLLPPVLQALVRPCSGVFKVTPKSESMDRDFISSYGWPVQVLFLLNVATIGVGVARLFAMPEDIYPTGITLFWAGLNVFVLAAALGAISERKIEREETIVKVGLKGRIESEGGEISCEVAEMGNRACWIQAPLKMANSLTPGDFVMLKVYESEGEEFRLRVRYRRLWKDAHGRSPQPSIEFEYAPESTSEISNRVRLMYGDSQRWVDFQSSRPGSAQSSEDSCGGERKSRGFPRRRSRYPFP